METFAQKVESILEVAWRIEGAADYEGWARRTESFLSAALGTPAAEAFSSLGGPKTGLLWQQYRDRQTGHLEGLTLRIESVGLADSRGPEMPTSEPVMRQMDSNRVFLVHGRDHGAKEAIARFLERLGLEPIILHEQANEGRTVIEKFEAHADVAFAVVLMTGDDTGCLASEPTKIQPRARQNVILELGYFTGKLGRRRVSALFVPGLEVPSDLHGVLFHELDSAGAWKMKLTQDLVSAGLKPNLEALLR